MLTAPDSQAGVRKERRERGMKDFIEVRVLPVTTQQQILRQAKSLQAFAQYLVELRYRSHFPANLRRDGLDNGNEILRAMHGFARRRRALGFARRYSI